MEETKTLIAQCSGLFWDATTSEQFAVKTDSVRINFSFNNRLGVNARLIKSGVAASQLMDSSFNQPLVRNKNLNYFKTYYVVPGTHETQPYWLENEMAEGYFNVTDQLYIGVPDVEPSFWFRCTIEIEGLALEYVKPVRYKFTDPVKGELYEPLVVLPPVLIAPEEALKITRNNNSPVGVLKVQAKKKNVWGTVKSMSVPESGKATFNFTPTKFFLPERNAIAEINYSIVANKDYDYTFAVSTDTNSVGNVMSMQDIKSSPYYRELHEIKYDHIPYINYFTSAKVSNKKLDLKTYHKRIGYIVGAGDKVPAALEQMGFEVILLTDKELSRNNLAQYDAIITGVRAYNTNEWMNKHFDKLMRYVNDGGNLIVQYNTSNQIGPVRAKIGPYPFNISRTRVTDERAPVKILNPAHPVFNFPNKITDADFEGWIQERSIYHATAWDTTKFEAMLSMNDPGEKADAGSLIISKHGKGYFTYTGLVFFRELPAGVPGAYRLMANLIALNRKKAF